MVCPDSHRIPRVRRYLGVSSSLSACFRLRACHPLWENFPEHSANRQLQPRRYALLRRHPSTPTAQRTRCLHAARFGLFPFRSPLLGESNSLSFPPGTKMFQFPGLASPSLCVQQGDDQELPWPGFPIRKSPGQKLFAPHRSLSQLTTSFIACLCQGIHRMPLVASSLDHRCIYGIHVYPNTDVKHQRDCLASENRPGGDGRVRTGDPRLAKPVLSQLSYTPSGLPAVSPVEWWA